MSQGIWTSINPLTTSGLMLAGLLDDFKDAVMTGFAGTSRPAQLGAGGLWVDTTNQAAPNYYWAFKIYDGSVDTEIFRISILNGFGGTLTANGLFQVQEIAADALGPILHMVKNRIDSNGQVKSGDTVAEIRMTGRTDTATDPLVAYLKYTSTDDETSSEYGGTFTMFSVPDASSAITEHLRFIGGFVESVVAQKLNSLRLVSQNVATAATIAQLSASKILVEMTGATATAIQGINSGHDSKLIHIHNRSSAEVTLKHENTSAAAADRIKLLNSVDHIIPAQGTVSLYYCTTDTRWKLRTSATKSITSTVENISVMNKVWTAPAGVNLVSVSARPRLFTMQFQNMIDPTGTMYAWGDNSIGQLGLGNIIPRSSPIAVLGGLTFKTMAQTRYVGQTTMGLHSDGSAYAWGANERGQLGVGDITARSSPVAVLGGLKFSALYCDANQSYAITRNGKMYAWGYNGNGGLGVGDVNDRSSPVAVLGGLSFYKMIELRNSAHLIALTSDGTAYAWGTNGNGTLGLGDIIPRSSPVAVLGGLKFSKVLGCQAFGPASFGLTAAGVLYAWGSNANGQLGVGDRTDRSSPVAVLGGLTFKDVYATSASGAIFGLTTAGVLYAWGINGQGQLGLGDVNPRSSPVAVLGGLTFDKIFTNRNREVFGLTADGTLYAWGENQFGQSGVGDSASRSSPVAVLGGLKFTDVSEIGTPMACTKDGTLYAWGYNANGELGVGDVTFRSSPVAVLGITGVKQRMFEGRYTFQVTPLAAYDVFLSHGPCTFGNMSIGDDIESINIEYHK